MNYGYRLLFLICLVCSGCSHAEGIFEHSTTTYQYSELEILFYEIPQYSLESLENRVYESSNNDLLRLYLAYNYIDYLRFDDAIREATKVLEKNVYTHHAHAVCALAYIENGINSTSRIRWIKDEEYDKTKNHLEKALEIKPDYLYAQILMGYLLACDGQPEVGLELIEEVLRKKENYIDAMFWRGVICYDILYDYDKALDSFVMLEIPMPMVPSNSVEWGRIWSDLANTFIVEKVEDKELIAYTIKRAIALNSFCIEMRPWDARPYLELGKAFGLRGQYDQAIEYMTQSIEMRPAMESYCIRYQYYLKVGDEENARKDMVHALKMTSDLSYTCDRQIYSYRDKEDESSHWLETGLSLGLPKGDYHYFRGEIYLYKKEYERALSEFRLASEIGTEYIEAVHQAIQAVEKNMTEMKEGTFKK